MAQMPTANPNGYTQEDTWRVFRVMSEFVEGFERMGQIGCGVSIFGAARAPRTDPHYDKARRLAHLLAEAAKRRGDLLSPELVKQIVTIAEGDENMTIREAASCTLGALNVPGEPASAIIRNQYRG